MLLIDDILLSPVRGLLWVFREMYNSVQQEIEGEAESITNELSDLYMMLETGKISEAEFDAREKELLDRLDEIQDQGTGIQNEDDEKEER
ncbi:MAG: gas vesicle protein GvpG [Pseudomonadota bacterium]